MHGFIGDQVKANREFRPLCSNSVNSKDITLKQIRPIGRFGNYGFTYFRRIYCANIRAYRLTSLVNSRLFQLRRALCPPDCVCNWRSIVQCYMSFTICGVAAYSVCNPWSVETCAWWIRAVENLSLRQFLQSLQLLPTCFNYAWKA